MNEVKIKYDLLRVNTPRFHILADYALVKKIQALVESGKLTDTTVVPRHAQWNYKSILDKCSGTTPSYSTYQGCIDVVLNADHTIQVQIWDGDFCDGSRTDLGYIWTFAGEAWLELELFQSAVHHSWSRHLDVLLENRAKEKYKRTKEKLSALLLLASSPS